MGIARRVLFSIGVLAVAVAGMPRPAKAKEPTPVDAGVPFGEDDEYNPFDNSVFDDIRRMTQAERAGLVAGSDFFPDNKPKTNNAAGQPAKSANVRNIPRTSQQTDLPLEATPTHTSSNDGFVSLFDGRTLSGWHTNGVGSWTVEDGMIVGRLADGNRSSFGHLISDKEYSDFELRLKFMVDGNSGVYVRGAEAGGDGMIGLQVELYTPRKVGNLIELLAHPRTVGIRAENGASVLNRSSWSNTWNELAVVVHGTLVEVEVNGTRTAEVLNYATRSRGVVAFQLFDVSTKVSLKDVQIREIERTIVKDSHDNLVSPSEPANEPPSVTLVKGDWRDAPTAERMYRFRADGDEVIVGQRLRDIILADPTDNGRFDATLLTDELAGYLQTLEEQPSAVSRVRYLQELWKGDQVDTTGVQQIVHAYCGSEVQRNVRTLRKLLNSPTSTPQETLAHLRAALANRSVEEAGMFCQLFESIEQREAKRDTSIPPFRRPNTWEFVRKYFDRSIGDKVNEGTCYYTLRINALTGAENEALWLLHGFSPRETCRLLCLTLCDLGRLNDQVEAGALDAGRVAQLREELRALRSMHAKSQTESQYRSH